MMATYINNDGEREGRGGLAWVIGVILLLVVLFLLFTGFFGGDQTNQNTDTGGTNTETVAPPEVDTNTGTDTNTDTNTDDNTNTQ